MKRYVAKPVKITACQPTSHFPGTETRLQAGNGSAVGLNGMIPTTAISGQHPMPMASSPLVTMSMIPNAQGVALFLCDRIVLWRHTSEVVRSRSFPRHSFLGSSDFQGLAVGLY